MTAAAMRLLGGYLLADSAFLDALADRLDARRAERQAEYAAALQKTFLEAGVELVEVAEGELTPVLGIRLDDAHPTKPGQTEYYRLTQVEDHDAQGNHITQDRWVELEDISLFPPSLAEAFADPDLVRGRSYYVKFLNPAQESDDGPVQPTPTEQPAE
jgi:hypothetical protein